MFTMKIYMNVDLLYISVPYVHPWINLSWQNILVCNTVHDGTMPRFQRRLYKLNLSFYLLLQL